MTSTHPAAWFPGLDMPVPLPKPPSAAQALSDAWADAALGWAIEPVSVNVPRTTPRSISPKALRSLKEASTKPKTGNPLAGTVTPRFPATRVITPDVHDCLVEVYGGVSRVPPAGSLVTLADYAYLLKWAPESFRLTQPIYDQQPGETTDDYVLFQLYLRQSEFIPFAQGERKVRSVARFYRIFDDGIIPTDSEEALSRPPQTLLEGLRKAWSWDYRAQSRDARLLVAEAENAAQHRLRQEALIREEFNALTLCTLRASKRCIESGNPEMVKPYVLAFASIFGAKAPAGFIMDAIQHLDGPPKDSSITVTTPKGTAGALQFAWKPVGAPPAATPDPHAAPSD